MTEVITPAPTGGTPAAHAASHQNGGSDEIDVTGLTGAGTAHLNNEAASAAPTVNDDSGDGYSIGSRWLDTTADKEYVALDVTAGAAVWVETTATGGSLGAWTAYTPTLTATTTNPTLGSSTLTGFYKQMDASTYLIEITLVITTGGAWNAGSGNYEFALPFTAAASPAFQVMSAYIGDAGTAHFAGVARITAGATKIGAVVAADSAGARAVTNSNPVTWANGDSITIQGFLKV